MSDFEDRTLAKYQVIRELGRGSMGTVYLGHDPFVGRPVAIKVAHPERVASVEDGALYRKLFFREAQTAGLLKHPNITVIYDAGVDGEVYYIVMEYVHEHRTLESHCRLDALLELPEIVAIIGKCAAALDYAHRRGVVHRDIKPRNILVTAGREVKLTDFGIALIAGESGHESAGDAGSPLFMSPEQVRGERVTGQSDLFSLGLVLYELITGRHPYAGGNLEAIQHHILHTPAPPLAAHRAGIPAVMQRIVDRCLAKDPAQRYRTGMDLAGDLELVCDFLTPSRRALSTRDRFRTLRAAAVFREFPDNELWELVHACTWEQVGAGEAVGEETGVEQAYFVVLEGNLTVARDGRTLDTLGPGDCFGEWTFPSAAPGGTRVTAVEPATVMRIGAPTIERASVNCQLRVHRLMLHALAERLRRAGDHASREAGGDATATET